MLSNSAPFFRRSQRRVRIINCKTVLSNKARPECGQDTVPIPIPGSEYDHTIEPLERIGIGTPTAQDCQVGEFISSFLILNRLMAQNINAER